MNGFCHIFWPLVSLCVICQKRPLRPTAEDSFVDCFHTNFVHLNEIANVRLLFRRVCTRDKCCKTMQFGSPFAVMGSNHRIYEITHVMYAIPSTYGDYLFNAIAGQHCRHGTGTKSTPTARYIALELRHSEKQSEWFAFELRTAAGT